ncbi:hypothetical protein [Bacillus sp. CHD6a]|uniref:hypothetical protein n=1 Tax=Bacillus sp. CHD6a TaxID=1643452 RepID=UPI000AA2E645|nr:hypothetical protein [Bacillus sp. CHD6a]
MEDLRGLQSINYPFKRRYHDIQAAAYLCDRMIILKDGQIEETIRTQDLGQVQSSYAKKLLHSLLTI